MANVLLINSNRFKHPWPVIPFGLCSVATVLEMYGNHNVYFLDLCFSLNCEAEIQKAVTNFIPDLIGISIRNIDDAGGYSTHFLLEDVKNDVIGYCKKEFHGPIVIGGPSVGISGREMLEYFDLEYAIRGDGEAVMPEFVKETGILHLEFTDSIFNSPLAHTKDVLREVIRKNLDLKLHTMGLSPATIDEELLDLMKSAGFSEVDVGAESACDEILESLDKAFSRSDILNTASLLRRKRIPATWFIMLGARPETSETVLDTLNTIATIASKWDLVFISTGIRVYKGAPLADKIIQQNIHCTSDNFLTPVKLEPEKISLQDIQSIAKELSFRFPNFYFYEKDNIIPGWLLATAIYLLKVSHPRQPAWRILILLKKIRMMLGITLVMRCIYLIRSKSGYKKIRKTNGFSLITEN